MAVFALEKKSGREVLGVPELPDDERHIHEALAFKKGAVSFDIVFDAAGTAFILEIQGIDAGLNGIYKDLVNDPRISDEIKKFAKAFTRRKSGYSNPDWFENVADWKDEQLAFIPKQNRPQSIVNGNFDELFAFGKVLIKPLNDSHGNGIQIFDQLHAEEAQVYAAKVKREYGNFMAQSLIESTGAELAPESLRGHAASLRLVVPFEVVNGKPVVLLHAVGYQRVAPEAMPNGKEESRYERAGVVNYHRGAHSVPMSQSEYQRALPVVMDVLNNLLTKAESSRSYRKEFAERFQSQIYRVWRAMVDSLPRQFSVRADTYGFKSIEEMQNVIRFLRFAERELSFLDTETREKLAKKDVSVTIVHSSGTRGIIRIYVPKLFGGGDAEIDFTTWDTPGVLATILKDVANGRKPRR